MTRTYVVPGRIELVGKHVDYAGGRSLTCAVDLAITATARALSEPVVRIRNKDRRGDVQLSLDSDVSRHRGMPMWSTYAIAVIRRFARDFPLARTGVDIELRSTLPPSAGLSSSSAFIIAVASALADANDMDSQPGWRDLVHNTLERAEYYSAMETGALYGRSVGDDGVGVRGGAQDPIAIMCAEDQHVTQFSYLPARMERRVEWPSEYALVVGVSGVHATKTGNARIRYNRASDATRALLSAWNERLDRHDSTLAAALASDSVASHTLRELAEKGIADFPPTVLVARLAQFQEEIETIVPRTSDAISTRDYLALGAIVDRSQQMAEEALGNQVPETIFLCRSARDLGAVAASAFGAGFGGAVWAMVPRNDAEQFAKRWRMSYARVFPGHDANARWIVTRPGPPATSSEGDR